MKINLFSRKQPHENRNRVLPLQTIFDPGFLYKASGTLSATPGIRHTLLCSSISESMRETLLAEGFRAIGGETKITHTIFCTFALPTAPRNPRCLFNLYLDCSSYPFPWADWAAKQITASKRIGGLRRSLKNASPRFLVRCKNSHEYPFCLDDDTIDKFWLMDAEVYFRAVEKLYQG
jgi:hypothetical protein